MTRLTVLLLAFAALLVAAAPAAAQQRGTSSPQLIDAAVERGEIGEATGALYLAYAVAARDRLPARFRSEVPFEATMPLLRARDAARTLPESVTRARLREVLAARAPGDTTTGPYATRCDVLSVEPKAQRYESRHFFIDFNPEEIQTFSVEEYGEILDRAWEKEVGEYGWAEPPMQDDPEPSDDPIEKYHVRIDAALGPLIFGYVSNDGTHAGEVGDNPNTDWGEPDSQASCMGLNNDFSLFADPTNDVDDRQEARAALEATIAHEFLHSIQFAYGALTGEDRPDPNYSEGMATWMEDEVFDDANDNARYLYPDFRDSMGEHQGDPYSYWFVWRGMVERFGTNLPGASEDVYQRFWEASSRQQSSHLDALRAAFSVKGMTLEAAYHDFAVGARFVKDCGGPLAPPFCFEEAALYRSGDDRGTPESDGSIEQVGGSFPAAGVQEIEDNFTLNWVDLPRGAERFDVTLSNGTDDRRMRLTVACDTGADLRRVAAIGEAGEGRTTSARFNPAGCLSRPVATVTNLTQTAPNPEEDSFGRYRLTTSLAPPEPVPAAAPAPTQPAPGLAASQEPPCTARTTLRNTAATPRGRGVRIAFTRPAGARVDVDVFQHAGTRTVLGERLVARFGRRTRAFTWNGRANRRGRRVGDGVLSVRFRVRRADGTVEAQRRTLRRSRGRFAPLRAFDRPETCGGIRSFKLLRPVFGGRTNRANEVTFMLGGEATVRLEVRRGARVLLRRNAGTRAPRVLHRLRVDSERLARGELEFRLIVQGPAGRALVERLYARRL